MKQIAECKIGHAHPKPGYHYPVIRFPQDYQNLIGEHVKIFSTDFEGVQAFLVVTPDVPVRNGQGLINKSDDNHEKRLTALEQSIEEMKEILSQKAAETLSGGSDQEYGPSRIRTGDIHRLNRLELKIKRYLQIFVIIRSSLMT